MLNELNRLLDSDLSLRKKLTYVNFQNIKDSYNFEQSENFDDQFEKVYEEYLKS